MVKSFKHVFIVHDSFTQLGGAERVVGALCNLYPQAELRALVVNPLILKEVTVMPCRASFLQNCYNRGMSFKYLLPLIPLAVKSLRFPENSLIISSSSLFLKALPIPKNSCHIEYLHTPARFLYTDTDYVAEEAGVWLRPGLRLFLAVLRLWDVYNASKPHGFIANSLEVQNRILKFYKRSSRVVYPFIDLTFWHPVAPKQDFFLMGGRLQAHKNYEVVLEAFKQTSGRLKVFGTGRHESRLKKIAGRRVEFLGRINDLELRRLYSQAVGFIYPSLEDFGIMPLEAAACGTATLAYNAGGVRETLIAGETGEFFSQLHSEEIARCLQAWRHNKYLSSKLTEQARKFSLQAFEKNFIQAVEDIISQSQNEHSYRH